MRFPYRLPLLFLCALLCLPALAEDCSEIDLAKSAPASLGLRFELPFDQTGGFCTSFVVSDLLSYELGESVSPYDVAYTVHASKYRRASDYSHGADNDGLDEGGPGVANLPDILKALQERGLGVCPLNIMPAAWDVERQDEWEDYPELAKELLTIRKKMRRNIESTAYLKAVEKLDCKLGIQSQIPLGVEEILHILDIYKNKQLIDALQAMDQKACAGKYIPVDKNLILKKAQAKHLTKEIDRILEQEHKPMAWAFNTKEIAKFKVDGGPHEVSIIGRKKVDGQCMYVMRNSYGHDCDFYREPYKKNCDLRRGTFLLKASEIEKWNNKEIYYLEKRENR